MKSKTSRKAERRCKWCDGIIGYNECWKPSCRAKQDEHEAAIAASFAPVFFGKPKRDEWLNDATFKESQKSVDAARAAIAKAQGCEV